MASKRGSMVLVLLPHNIPESVEMLEILKMGLDCLQKKARLLIKCHPDYTSQDLKRAFGEQHWPGRFEFYQGTLVDAFKEAAVVISSNSGTIVEAAALGIPVIFVGRQTALNNNVLEDVETELIMECFTEKDLITAINKCLNLTSQEVEQYKALGEKILKLFFLPVTDDTMLPFLGDRSNHKWSPT
jgi:UDP-N-acetylglucosamine:LPS N-acetylglucosamine transferase